MRLNLRKTCCFVLLLAMGASRAPAASITLDLPELVGTHVYGDPAVQASVDFGTDFQPLWSITVEIEAAMVPPPDTSPDGTGPAGAELRVSAEGGAGMRWVPPTLLGPYGTTPSTDSVSEGYAWIAIWPPPITSGQGVVTLQTPEVWPAIWPTPAVEVLSARITAEYSPMLLGCGADVNCDGFVGIMELNIVLGNWNRTVPAGDMLSGDATGDGYVGIADLNAVLGSWNAGTPPTAVPEPAAPALLCIALLPMGLRRRL